MTKKRLSSNDKTKIILAIISVIPLILGIDWVGKLIIENNSSTPTPNLTSTPTLTPTPAISISNDVKNIGNQSIDINNAPFQVYVSGTASNADGLNVYLIVNDGYHHYVQPAGGANVDKEFSILCQLGIIDDPKSGGKRYAIYAVVTDDIYADYAYFEDKSFIVKSENIYLTREKLPTPESTP